MSIMTSAAAIKTRHLLRKTGITKIVMRYLRAHDYEALLTAAMHRSIKPGYCVWDVGANVGHYSRLFSEWTGQHGSVYALEPSKATRQLMNTELPANMKVIDKALGAEPGVAWLDRRSDDDGATARISDVGTEKI